MATTYGQPQAPQGVKMLSTPKPLTSKEIKTGMIYRLAEVMIRTIFDGVDPLPQELLNEVVDSMTKHIQSCNLNGKAYSDYEFRGSFDVTFNNFGQATGDHFEFSGKHGELGPDTTTVHLEFEKESLPPNLERVETELPVPVSSMGRGTANVKYPKPRQSSIDLKKVERR